MTIDRIYDYFDRNPHRSMWSWYINGFHKWRRINLSSPDGPLSNLSLTLNGYKVR